MNTFFTSDFHLNHLNIIKYCNRPFKTLEQMNSTIIARFNERIKEDDFVFFLGDFIFRSGSNRGEGEKDKPLYFLNQLNCKHIVFIGGNHDKNNSLKTSIKSVVIKYGGKNVNLTHNPEFCNTNYELNIVGHVHDRWKIKRFIRGNSFTDCINVSVEQWNYYPVTWDEINQVYSQWLKENK